MKKLMEGLIIKKIKLERKNGRKKMFVNWYREEIRKIKKINEKVKVTVWRKDFLLLKQEK